jgi:hypothetical protein
MSTAILLLAALSECATPLAGPLRLPSLTQLVHQTQLQPDDEAVQDAAIGAPPGAPIQAQQPLGDPFGSLIDLNWLGTLSDNLLFAVDVSGRVQYNTSTRQWSTTQFYGFDLYKVFSDDTGDIATMVLQGFATRIDNVNPHPFFFSHGTDWQFLYRMFHVNVRVDPRGRMNVKVGHYEMPFGIEALLNSNGTLRQFGTARNLGVKADWGVTLNGVTRAVEYEVGIGRGSGMEWHSTGSPFQFAGRVGTIRDADQWIGLSGFWGDLWRPNNVQLERRRIGIDLGMHRGPFTWMAEVSGGTNDGDAAVNALLELDWHAPDDEWLLYGQFQAWTQDTNGWDDNLQLILGMQWAMDSHLVLSLQYIQNLTMFNDASRAAIIQFQTRYRF